MNDFRPLVSKIKRSHIIIPLLILLTLSFIISTVLLSRNADSEVDKISCTSGTFRYSPESNTQFYYYSIEIRKDFTTSCSDSSPGYLVYPTITIYDSKEEIYESSYVREDTIITYDNYIRIIIVHNEGIIPGYEIIINMRHYNISKVILNSIMACLGISVICILISVLLIKKKPRGILQKDVSGTPTTVEILNETSVNDKLSQEIKFLKSNLIRINYDQIPDKAICMISKTTFEKDDEIAQCTHCLSCYLLIYILDWLDKNDHCPVCQVKLD